MNPEIANLYSNKIRIRVCGVLIESNRLLLIQHKGLGSEGVLWSLPGGGLEFGESVETCLKREFLEETGLDIGIKNFLFVNEFKNEHLHAIELFFHVHKIGGALRIGSDPEMGRDHQTISDLKFVTNEELEIMTITQKHNMLHDLKEINDLLKIKGYFKFCE